MRKRIAIRSSVTISLIAFLGVLAATQGGSVVGRSTGESAPPGPNFSMVGGSYNNLRYSTLDQITPANVRQLGGAWSIHLEDERPIMGNLQGTPVVIDGVMYVTTSRLHVFAIDAVTGAVKWRYRPGPDARVGANKGVAVGDGKVF